VPYDDLSNYKRAGKSMQADKDLMAVIMPFYSKHIGKLFSLLDDLFQCELLQFKG